MVIEALDVFLGAFMSCSEIMLKVFSYSQLASLRFIRSNLPGVRIGSNCAILTISSARDILHTCLGSRLHYRSYVCENLHDSAHPIVSRFVVIPQKHLNASIGLAQRVACRAFGPRRLAAKGISIRTRFSIIACHLQFSPKTVKTWLVL